MSGRLTGTLATCMLWMSYQARRF
ncbi:hypothetical protein OOU_Y34scaffold00255g43 [Pyricularia oryzae Y34]|uniref:Uncharacterized protein n=2 Tax=Pyricularia oryzae TaxID=318829 RepID=A0AA97P4E6_PYRO3|nr:hypothetical protein OOU_Y34scaffold00255g43 [Pyricularia oryzae Y34]